VLLSASIMARHLLFTVVATVVLVAFSLVLARPARADTWQAPVGGAPIAGKVACGPLSGGWSATAGGIEPPKDRGAIGQPVDARVAASAAECATAGQPVTLVALGDAPAVDAASVTWFVDEGRLELHGRGLGGSRLEVFHDGKRSSDTCLAPVDDPATRSQSCTFSVPRGLPANADSTRMRLLPAGAKIGDDVVTYDARGRNLGPEDARVVPAKMIVSRVEAADAALDLGSGRIQMDHPEAVASADCAAAHCERADDGVHVRSTGAVPAQLTVRLHLAPHVFLASGASDTSFSVQVLACPVRIVSGPPIRSADETRVAIEVDPRCGDSRALKFTANGRTADRVTQTTDGRTVLVSVGRIESDELVVVATRDGATVGQARDKTKPLPPPHAVLQLPGGQRLDFVPTNRSTNLSVAEIDGPRRYVPLPEEGVYSVESDKGQLMIRGEPDAVGMVSLRFAVRDPELPGPLAGSDLALVVEPVERPVHAANVPVSLGSSAMGNDPIVELVCTEDDGLHRIVPGDRSRIPFGARDGCRLVFHRERIPDEAGAQLLNLDIDVVGVDGSARPEAHVAQPIILRHAATPRLAWIKGVQQPFDRITVHLAHVVDEAHYVGAEELRTGAPAVQWGILAGTGHARLYATTAIPTGLYRVSDTAHSGILALNFGALARLTWLDQEGHAGFLGLEAGIMGVGLANDQSLDHQSLTQVATVSGIGLSVPIANRGNATETSVNLHAWYEFEPSRAIGGAPGNPSGFVFGPSISIGNIGTNL
jgi:hypothetical protein